MPSLLWLFLCFFSSIHAQDNRIEFEHISIEQGLSQSNVNCILQDSKGLMWFGTQDGLNKYDGYSFDVYNYNPSDSTSISDNNISALCEDGEGDLWIGTQNGLNRLDHQSGIFYRYVFDPDTTGNFGSNMITSLCEDSKGSVLVGRYGGGLIRIKMARGRASDQRRNSVLSNSLESEAILSIYKDRSGVIWVGTSGGGLLELDPAYNVLARYQNDPGDENSLSQNNVRCIHEDRSGTLWVGTDNGLNRLERDQSKFRRYSLGDDPRSAYSNYVFCIDEDGCDRLWVGTDEGLELYQPATDSFYLYRTKTEDLTTLSDDAIMSICDAGGVVWFGSRKGLNKYCRYKKKFQNYRRIPQEKNSLSDNKVWSIYSDPRGILWVGSNGGLDRIDRRSNRYVHYHHESSDPGSLSNNSVMSILEDESGYLWIGTWGGGLDKLDRRTGKFTHYARTVSDSVTSASNTIVSLCEDGGDRLMMGTYAGLVIFDLKKEKYQTANEESTICPALFHDPIEAIRLGKKRKLWFGTWNGLVEYDLERKVSRNFRHRAGDTTSLSHDRVLSILPTEDSRLYLGTLKGLHFMKRAGGEFDHFTHYDGLPNDVICGILEDDGGSLWISTNKGISKFDPSSHRVRNYDVSDGLQSNEFNQWASFKSPSGEMFFGGIDGVTSFFPDSLHDNPHIPPIVLTSLKVNDKDMDLGELLIDSSVLQLSHEDNNLSFEFAALDYTKPEKNQYAHMLEGFETGWTYSGTRHFASYTNLDPGDYMLRLKGSNNDGVWSENGIYLRFSIAPPFWMTWWFRSGAILGLLSCAMTLYVARTKAVKKRNQILEREVEERTRELKIINENLSLQVLQRLRTENELWKYKNQLEEQVQERTAELSETVSSLEQQIAARELAERNLLAYQEKLRSLAFDLSSTEERERRRLSTYLHDSIGQTLAFCKIKLRSVQRSARLAPSDKRLQEILKMIEQSIADTRELTLELSPPILHELGLIAALEWLCHRFQDEHDIRFSISAESDLQRLDADLSVLLFHAAREVLVNIIKHANAKNATIGVRREEDWMTVEIEDDGCGFDAAAGPDHPKQREGFGLFSIRERLHSLGGRMEIASKPGFGTIVTLVVPLRSDSLNSIGS